VTTDESTSARYYTDAANAVVEAARGRITGYREMPNPELSPAIRAIDRAMEAAKAERAREAREAFARDAAIRAANEVAYNESLNQAANRRVV
jgi:hypothetical protein